MRRLTFVFPNLICALTAATLGAAITYTVRAPHDAQTARDHIREWVHDIEQTQALTHEVEWSVVVDVATQPKDELDFASRKTFTRLEIEKKLGRPGMFDEDKYARPWAGNWIIPLSGVSKEDLDPRNDRIHFYEINDAGGVLIIYDKDSRACSPAVLYLKINKEFVPLKHDSDFKKRVKWELPRLQMLKQQLQIKGFNEGKAKTGGDAEKT